MYEVLAGNRVRKMPEWMPIVGFERYYQISNMGEVKALPKIVTSSYSTNGRHWPERPLKPFKTGKGYLTVTLRVQKRHQSFKVHRLVAIHFIPNPDNLPEVNHLDGDKSNNTVSNLEWCTPQRNHQHAIESKLRNPRFGIKHSDEVVMQIVKESENGLSRTNISNKLGIARPTVAAILGGFIRWEITGITPKIQKRSKQNV